MATALAVGLVVGMRWSHEPRYQGKTLREWLAPSSSTLQVSFHTGQEGFEVGTNNGYVQAIQSFGLGAVPVLRRELRAEDSSLKLMLVSLLAKTHLWQPRIIEAGVRRHSALRACQILGPVAKDLIPDLARLLSGSTNRSDLAPICRALSFMGPAAFPVLLAGLTNQNPTVQYETLEALGRVWYDKSVAVPQLLELRQSSDRRLTSRALVALARTGPMELSANALVPVLHGTNTTLLLAALGTMNDLGTNAGAALPALLNLVSNAPSEEITDAARKAISNISPAPELN